MKIRKYLSLLTALVLCISIMTACGNKEKENDTGGNNNPVEGNSTNKPTNEPTNEPTVEAQNNTESTDPLSKITQGYYVYAYPVDGIGDFTYYFHFYEEAPVIGSVFYAGFAMNQINFAGTYTVEEKVYEYACFATREESTVEGAVPLNGTAPYTITFYDWTGNVMDSCGFDGDIIYNDMTVIMGVGGGPCYYNYDTEGEASKYYDSYQAEVGVTYLDFVAEDPTSTITLYHNGKYMDLVDMMVEGSYIMTETTDGYEYILTPDSEFDTPAVLAVSADMTSITYTQEGGEPVSMRNAAEAGPKVFLTMVGETPIPGQDDTGAAVTVYMFDDGTLSVTAAAFGQEIPLDGGTYSMGSNGYTITFQFDNAGEIVSTLDAETHAVSIQYILGDSMLGAIDTILTVVTE